MNKFSSLFIAGTFDHFHAGHKTVLSRAFEQGARVTIGITSDAFIKKYKKLSVYQLFSERKKNIEQYIHDTYTNTPYEIISIEDPYEPAASFPFDALIVTSQNLQTGEEINIRRKAKNLPVLQLIDVAVVPAVDGIAISSTRIRNGELDVKGNLLLPDSLREALKKPLGVITDPQTLTEKPNQKIITVGDVTTDVFVRRGIIPDLSIIDLYAQRQWYKSLDAFHFPPEVTVVPLISGPGFISHNAREIIARLLNAPSKSVLLVTGEDDLLVLPAILEAAEGTVVYYGQPNVGLVRVEVTPDCKTEVQSIIAKFIATA